MKLIKKYGNKITAEVFVKEEQVFQLDELEARKLKLEARIPTLEASTAKDQEELDGINELLEQING